MPPEQIYAQAATYAVLVGALVLFVTERIPVDVTALLVPLTLGVLGVLTPGEALQGFGNPAVVTVASMFVVSKALVTSGAVNALGSIVQRLAGKTQRQAILAIALVVSVVSAFMNNTPVVVVFLPIVLGIASEAKMAPSKLLIPLSYVTILGGCCTLIGTSTTVLVSSEIARRGLEPIGFFEPLPVGVLLFGAGTLYMMLLAPRLLPERRSVTSMSALDRVTEYVTEVSVLPGSPLVGKSLREAILDRHPDVHVIEIVRGEEILWPGAEGLRLSEGDLVLVRGKAQAVAKIGASDGAEILPDLPGAVVRGRDVTLVELVITQGSPLVGRTVRESTIRALQGSTVMAVERRGSHLRTGIADMTLAVGDTLLVQTETARLPQFRGSDDFVLLEGLHEELTLKRRAPWVLAVTIALVALASTEVLDVSFLAVAAAVTLVLTKCLSVRQAYRSLDMSTLILMGSTIAFGTALEKSGAADWLASHLLDFARAASPEGYEPYAALGACYLLCNVLTAFASNSAAALLVLPIALGAAAELGVSNRPFVFAVAFAASLDFATPTGYQTNLLVYGPGGYRYSDYVRFGGLLNLIFLAMAVVLLPQFFPF